MISSKRISAPRWTLGLGSVLLTLLLGGFALNDRLTSDAVWQLHMETQGKLQASALRSAQQDLLLRAELIGVTLAHNRPLRDRLLRLDALLRDDPAALESTAVAALRDSLITELTPVWRDLQQHRATQLQLYWGKSGIAVARMQDPSAWGDATAARRPLLDSALREGQVVSALDIGRHGAGHRAVVPLRRSEDPGSDVIGAVEVGFGILPDPVRLGELLDAGIGLLINRAEYAKVLGFPPSGVQFDAAGDWLLAEHSAPQVLEWTRQQQVRGPGANQAVRLLESAGRTYLLNRIPLRGFRPAAESDQPPLAVALVWRDVTPALNEHLQAGRQVLVKWTLAWLVAEALLLLLAWLLFRRSIVQRQHRLAARREERSRKQLLDRSRKIASLLPGMVYQLKRHADGRFEVLYASQGSRALFGLEPETLMADSRAGFVRVHPQDRWQVQGWLAKSAQQLRSSTLRFRIDHPSRGLIWADIKASAEQLPDGAILWHGFATDSTARAVAEREASERERYVRLLIANVADAIITIDARGHIETFNHAAERMFGYYEREMIGGKLAQLMPEPYRDAHDQYLSDHPGRRRSGALERNRELLAQRRNGEVFTIELRVSEISHHGARKYIGLIRDITERKRVERMKSEFVSIVSHELRTPLTSITGALGLLTGGALGEAPATMQQMLDIAHQNSLRLGRLINDLLDMDKLIAGKLSIKLRVQPLAPQLEEALRANQGYAQKHQVRFELAKTTAASVSVDENRLQQVLANFLSNGAKFSPPGEVVVVSAESDGQWVRVSVLDNGPGVPQKFHERIFQKFSQADSSDTRQKGGTGLGLAISKELVERMRGRIGFESEPGMGACFWFELPAIPSQNPEPNSGLGPHHQSLSRSSSSEPKINASTNRLDDCKLAPATDTLFVQG